MKELKPRMTVAGVICMNPSKFSFSNILALCGLLLSVQVKAVCNPDVTPTKPDRIYIDNGNGTVTDTETELMWMKCTLGRSGSNCGTGTPADLDWKQALDAAQEANAGAGTFGYTDWRLPSLNELLSLAEMACYSPAINATIFPVTQSLYYWTSTQQMVDNRAWLVNFATGQEIYSITQTTKERDHFVRLVRNAQ